VALYRELRRAMRGPCAVPRGSRILVACSGGPDSLALLLGLHELKRPLGFELAVAHLDHGLRGPAAQADARSVARRASALGLPFFLGTVNARKELGRRKLSGEAGLRTLRLEFLRLAADEAGADFIALGHTADDQAETVLFRLARGTGLRGLGGMRARRGAWLRPLLGATRAEVTEFLRARRVTARVDRTNADRRFARNRIRHETLVSLRHLNPQAGVAIASAAARMGAVADLLNRMGRRALRRAEESSSPSGLVLVRSTLLRYHPMVRENALRQAWERIAPGTSGLTRKHLTSVETLLQAGIGGSRVHLPADRVARLDRGLLFLGGHAA
jgi:tRNA(Ile)-lysidine synthase